LNEKPTADPRIRANRYSVMTLEWPLVSGGLREWLEAQCAKAPLLMREIAVVLKPAEAHSDSEIIEAVEIIGNLGIGLIGLTGNESHKLLADRLELSWISSKNVTAVDDILEQGSQQMAMIVEGPIRSGVQIYAKDRDLIVFGQVSEGAEIMADGHVMIYGRVRGRIAAGVSGRHDAEIFCQTFEPELLSIAGIYVGYEQIPEGFWSATVRIRLDSSSNALIYTTL